MNSREEEKNTIFFAYLLMEKQVKRLQHVSVFPALVFLQMALHKHIATQKKRGKRREGWLGGGEGEGDGRNAR